MHSISNVNKFNRESRVKDSLDNFVTLLIYRIVGYKSIVFINNSLKRRSSIETILIGCKISWNGG